MAPGSESIQLKQIIKSMLDSVGKRQINVAKEVTSLKKEIFKFFDATKFPEYGKVYNAMEETNVIIETERLVAHLLKNHSFVTHDKSEKLAKNFAEWAEWLDGKKDDEGKKQEQEPAESPEQQVDEFLFALLDIIINEQVLRENTIDAEKQKELKNYLEKTAQLAENQQQIIYSLTEIIIKAPSNEIRNLLVAGTRFMMEAQRELKSGKTGQDAVNAESAAIEILAKAFAAGAPQSSDQQSMMQMLAAAMGQNSGQAPGNQPTGTSAGPDRAVNDNFLSTHNKEVSGNSDEKKHHERLTDKFVGESLEEVPVEYRKLLEEYYKKVENQKK